MLNQRLGGADVDRVLGALSGTGLPVFDSRNSITTPRIRIYDALNTLPGGTPTSSGLQITPDGKRTLVSKDVGSERWAITLNADDGSVTGNVFTPGEDPTFLWCEFASDDGNPDPANVLRTYSCQAAERCTLAPCAPSQWSVLPDVVVPGWFFQP